MSADLEQAGQHEAPGHDMSGQEPGIGSMATKIVVKGPDGFQGASLDADHDGVVTMGEIAPPRPESGHDIVNAVAAEGLLAGALVLTAAYAGFQHRRAQRRRGEA